MVCLVALHQHRSALPTLDTVSISSTLMESTDGPVACPTPRSTRVTKSGKNHNGAPKYVYWMNVGALFVVLDVSLYIY